MFYFMEKRQRQLNNNKSCCQVTLKLTDLTFRLLPYQWRTLAHQEVIIRICPLGKPGHFESTAEFFFVYIVSVSLASGPILSITSWYAKVLNALSYLKPQSGGVRGGSIPECVCGSSSPEAQHKRTVFLILSAYMNFKL